MFDKNLGMKKKPFCSSNRPLQVAVVCWNAIAVSKLVLCDVPAPGRANVAHPHKLLVAARDFL